MLRQAPLGGRAAYRYQTRRDILGVGPMGPFLASQRKVAMALARLPVSSPDAPLVSNRSENSSSCSTALENFGPFGTDLGTKGLSPSPPVSGLGSRCGGRHTRCCSSRCDGCCGGGCGRCDSVSWYLEPDDVSQVASVSSTSRAASVETPLVHTFNDPLPCLHVGRIAHRQDERAAGHACGKLLEVSQAHSHTCIALCFSASTHEDVTWRNEMFRLSQKADPNLQPRTQQLFQEIRSAGRFPKRAPGSKTSHAETSVSHVGPPKSDVKAAHAHMHKSVDGDHLHYRTPYSKVVAARAEKDQPRKVPSCSGKRLSTKLVPVPNVKAKAEDMAKDRVDQEHHPQFIADFSGWDIRSSEEGVSVEPLSSTRSSP